MRTIRVGLLSVGFAIGAIAVMAQGCADQNALVGGECAPRYEQCGGNCVDLTTDSANCGQCGATCPANLPCGSSFCGGPPDGSFVDGSTDGSFADGRTDGSLGDGARDDGNSEGDACPPGSYNTVANCGACGVVCVAPTNTCRTDINQQFTCQLPCNAPLIQCSNVCVDLQTDPFNCGACGKFCPSNVCVGGLCQGGTPGDIVVIGHDYRSPPAASSQAKLLANAVFIPTSNPLRVLSYEQFSEAAAVSTVKSIIASLASGRTVKYTVATAASFIQASDLVVNYDVVLIYDQVIGTAAQLGTIATAAANPLTNFAKAGGVVVTLDGASGQGAMPTFLKNAGLLDVSTHVSIPAGTLVQVAEPGDKVGSGVIGPYATFDRSATFQPNVANGGNVHYVASQLVGGITSDPVVVHIVVP